MPQLKHKLRATVLFASLLLGLCLLVRSSPTSAFSPDPNLPNCFTASSRTHTFCDPSYYGPNATAPESVRLQPGKCYVEDRGGPNGDLRGYTEYDCSNVEDTNQSSPSVDPNPNQFGNFSTGDIAPTNGDICGSGDSAVHISLNIGCRGVGNPIVDGLFAIIRWLSIGVGLVVIASLVVAGIQYSSAQGNPQAVADAQKRIAATVGALILYILAYALLNWLVPGGLFT